MVGLDSLGEFLDRRRRLVPDDCHPRPVVLELAGQFAGGVERVVFDDHRAKAQDRVEGNDVLGAVRQDQGDPVPRLDAQPAQAFRGLGDLPAQLRVAGAAAEEFGGRAVAGLRDRVAQTSCSTVRWGDRSALGHPAGSSSPRAASHCSPSPNHSTVPGGGLAPTCSFTLGPRPARPRCFEANPWPCAA